MSSSSDDLRQRLRSLRTSARRLRPDDSRRVRCLELLGDAESSLMLAQGYVAKAERALRERPESAVRVMGGWRVE
jgi:hypothetical protein